MIKHGPILYFIYCVSGHSVSSLLLILAFFLRKTFKSEKKKQLNCHNKRNMSMESVIIYLTFE